MMALGRNPGGGKEIVNIVVKRPTHESFGDHISTKVSFHTLKFLKLLETQASNLVPEFRFGRRNRCLENSHRNIL
jgi:hypothetical protein